MQKYLFITPRHNASPMARTASMTLLVAIILAVMGLSWRLATPSPVQDHHVDGELLQGLSWLSQSLHQGSPPQYDESLACDTSLSTQLAKIAANLDNKHHLTLQKPDCSQLRAVNKAARYLLNKDADKIRDLLKTPIENLEDKIAIRDPFRLPGCLFLHGEPTTIPSVNSYCQEDPGWRGAGLNDLPPSSEALWANLAVYRQALRSQSPNTFLYKSSTTADMVTPFAQGRHQFLSLDENVQKKAQVTAACYSGDTSACAECPWCNTLSASQMYEGARARMVGVLVVDVHDGGILAAASHHSRCYAAQHSGSVLPTDCPVLPTPPANRPLRLKNHALEQEVMPASLVKIPLAAGLMEADIPATSRDEMVKDWLVHSDTEAFIDTVFCKDQGFQTDCAKKRLAAVQKMVSSLSWNFGCDGKNTGDCGKQDLIGAGLLANLAYPVLTGRLLLGRNNALLPVEHLNLSSNAIQACYKQGHKNRWRDCSGADFINTLAELYGQGNAIASPVGIAQLLLQLAAAESGQAQAPIVHVLQQLDGSKKQEPIAPLQRLAMRPETAKAIIGAMAQTHLQLKGTAHGACSKAAEPGGLLGCKDGKDMALRLAGKTGTPLFPADTLKLSQWREQCARPPTDSHESERHQHERTRCRLSPFKWYAVLVGNPGTHRWDKAVIVLAERNWNQRSGFVDSAEDNGSNVAAEVGLAVANVLSSPADTVWNKLIEPISPPIIFTTNKARQSDNAVDLNSTKHSSAGVGARVLKSTVLKSSSQPLDKYSHNTISKRKPNQAALRYHHYSSGYKASR